MNPDAASYYQRLGIEPDASKKDIKKSGKLAFNKYANGDREQFLRVRRARETLEENRLRKIYDTFYEELGPERGTQAFETWRAQGSNQNRIDQIIEETGEDSEDPGDDEITEDMLWESLDIDDPKIEWSNRDFPEAFNVDLWTKNGKRLYLNNFHPEHDVYLDLDTGTFYTNNYESVSDMNYRIIDEGQKLFISGDPGEVKIDLVGNSTEEQTLEDVLKIENPQAKWTDSGDPDSINVEHWTKHGSRLYLNNFSRDGSIYLDLKTGHFKSEDGYIINDVYFEIRDSGRTLYVDLDGKQAKISLLNNISKRNKKNRQKNENRKQKERRKKKQKKENKKKRNKEKKEKEHPEPTPRDAQSTWLQERVESVRSLLENKSPALLLLFNLLYGVIALIVVLAALLAMVLSLLVVIPGSFAVVMGSLATLLFPSSPFSWGEVGLVAMYVIVCFLTLTLSVTILEQFGIDLGE